MLNEREELLLEIANKISQFTKCKSRKVGAIAVRDGRIVTAGFNGPPMKYPHCEPNCTRKNMGFNSGKGLEYCPAEHAERNVINEAARFGISLKDTIMYENDIIPCRECAKAIVNAGIKEVVVLKADVYPEPGITGFDILSKCGVKIRSKI